MGLLNGKQTGDKMKKINSGNKCFNVVNNLNSRNQ